MATAIPVTAPIRALFRGIQFHDVPSAVAVIETEATGKGTATFDVAAPCILIRGKAKGTVFWRTGNRCADGAVIVMCEDGPHVHLVELKRTVTSGSWDDMKEQFDGMLVAARAILGVAGLPPPRNVTCHVAFREDKLAAALIQSKVVTTAEGPIVPAGVEWASRRVKVLDHPSVKVERMRLDQQGHGRTALDC